MTQLEELFKKRIPVNSSNIELQLHHFRKDNIDQIFHIMNNENVSEYLRDLIAITMFINIYNFIYDPIQNNLYFSIHNNKLNLNNEYTNLKTKTENVLKYIYDLFSDSFTSDKLEKYITIVRKSINNIDIDDNIDDNNKLSQDILYFLHNHFFKDLEYYFLMNNFLDGALSKYMLSFIPIIQLFKKNYSDNICKGYLNNTQETRLRSIIKKDDIYNLQTKLISDINIIKHINYVTFTNYDKIFSKRQKDIYLYINSYNIKKIAVLTDYILTYRYKLELLKNKEELTTNSNNFLNKITNYLDNFSNRFPKIFSYNERKSFLTFIVNILQHNIFNNLTLLPYYKNTSSSYNIITNLYNNKTENNLFPYIFRYGRIEQCSPLLRNTSALYFMMAALICLKQEINTRNDSFIVTLLEEYINNTKKYIIDISEIKEILDL